MVRTTLGAEVDTTVTVSEYDTPQVYRVELIVAQAPGASDIDMTQTTMSFVAPDGSHDLTYEGLHIEAAPQEDDTFTLSAVADDDGTIPVMTSGDRFTLHLNPGYLNAATSSELSITTPSGATLTMEVRVPDSLANQQAVSL